MKKENKSCQANLYLTDREQSWEPCTVLFHQEENYPARRMSAGLNYLGISKEAALEAQP